MNPIKVELAERLGSVEEYYFSKKLREIDEMRAAGREVINLGIGSPDQPQLYLVETRFVVRSQPKP